MAPILIYLVYATLCQLDTSTFFGCSLSCDSTIGIVGIYHKLLQGTIVMTYARCMQIQEVPSGLDVANDSCCRISIRICLTTIEINTFLLIATLQTVIESFLVWIVVNLRSIVTMGHIIPRHTHIGKLFIVIGTLDHAEISMGALYVSPAGLIHLTCTPGTWTTEYSTVATLCLSKEQERFCMFGHNGTVYCSLHSILTNYSGMQLVIQPVDTDKVALHRRGIVNLVHQLLCHGNTKSHLISHTTILTITINPAIGHCYLCSGTMVRQGALSRQREVLTQIATLQLPGADLSSRLTVAIQPLVLSIPLCSNTAMQHSDRNCNFTLSILDLHLDIMVVICLGSGALVLLWNTLCGLTDLTRQFRQIVSFSIIAVYLDPTSLAFVGILVVWLISVPDEYILLNTRNRSVTGNIVESNKAGIGVNDIVYSLQFALLIAVRNGRYIILEHIFWCQRLTLPDSDSVDIDIGAILSDGDTAITHSSGAEL